MTNKEIIKDSMEIEYNGEKHTVSKWAEIYGIATCVLLERLNKGMKIEEALIFTYEKRERLITYKGRTLNLRQWSDLLGIPYYCLRSRFNTLHWTVEKAFETPYEALYEGAKNDK